MTSARPPLILERPSQLPALVFDREAIRAVDRDAVREYHVPGVVLMENAALGLAAHARRVLARGATALVCCGTGNNGGDGYALARHLHNAGVRVVLAPLGRPAPGGDAAVNDAICRAMGIPRIDRAARDSIAADLLVDAILGTGLDRPVAGDAADWIAWMNSRPCPRLAVDLPSGLDCDAGRPLGSAVRADLTVTFVGLKRGFLAPEARPHLGAIAVVDIGAPVELYLRHGRRLDSASGAPDASDPADGR
jgi:NAD(P)H-hydrate epimerase